MRVSGKVTGCCVVESAGCGGVLSAGERRAYHFGLLILGLRALPWAMLGCPVGAQELGT